VYIDEAWLARVGKPQATEESMLEFAYERRDNSRLSCQIVIAAELDGLVVRLPKDQGWK
jgi:2Fe-2S ferredoxin